jgi:hypothetical protein
VTSCRVRTVTEKTPTEVRRLAGTVTSSMVDEAPVMVSKVPFQFTVTAAQEDELVNPEPWMVRGVAPLSTVIGFGVMEEIVGSNGVEDVPVTENAAESGRCRDR